MKKVKFLVLTVAILVSSLFSVNATNVETGKNPVSEQVKSYVKYPKFGYETPIEGKVMIVFTVDIDNKIKIENVITENSLLEDYIYSVLEGKKVSVEKEQVKEQYAISFDFQYVE